MSYELDGTLSDKELAYLQDQQFLLSKIEISKKIEQLMGEVEKQLYAIIPHYSWPTGVLVRSGKLSKGENYRGLPYYMLDYPRRFDQENVFSFRTMFWWGNFFSATLHLGGQYLAMSREALYNNTESLRSSEAYICVNNNPWEYHYGKDNYLKLQQLTADQIGSNLDSNNFLKLSQHWELDRYPELPTLVSAVFREMISWLVEPA